MRIQRRRGISPIIAELLLVAVTVVLGTSIFFIGSSSIGGYANGFSVLFGKNAAAAQEIYVVEYAQFNTSPTHSVTITVRNVGTIETELASVSMFSLSTVGGGYPTSGTYTNTTSPALAKVVSTASPYCKWSDRSLVIPVGAFCTVSVPFNWYAGAAYNLVISTARGNRVVVQEVA